MRGAWLARDRMGQLALFVREAPAPNADLLEAEARVLGALCARDGNDWLAGREDDDGAHRVVAVVGGADREAGYRASAISVEDRVSGASWVVAREEAPRVLVSTRALTREERDDLRACDDCAAVIAERTAHDLVWGRKDAVHFYARADRAYARAIGVVTRPLRARSVHGKIARLPLEFTSSPAVFIRDDFDGSRDGAWIETPYRLGAAELIVNFVRTACYFGLFLAAGAYVLTHSAALTVLATALGVAAITAFVSRGAKESVIAARREPPVRVATEAAHVRVSDEASQPEEDEGSERRAADRP